jgi:hypothetical protein
MASMPPGTVLGAHRVEVRLPGHLPARLDLMTDSAARAYDWLAPAVEMVERDLPRSSGTFWYLAPDGVPRRFIDPLRCAVFLADNIHRIEREVRRIATRPSSVGHDRNRIAPLPTEVDVKRTRELLVRHSGLLSESTTGPITIAGHRYAPALVVNRVVTRSRDAEENRRLAAFLRRLHADTGSALVNRILADSLRDAVLDARLRLTRLLRGSFLRAVPAGTLAGPRAGPVGREHTDPGYRALRRMRSEYLQRVSPAPSLDDLHRKFRASAEDIYEAFVAFSVAQAFDMTPCQGGFRRSGYEAPTFASGEWELFFNSAFGLRSWRVNTTRPDNFRPDVVLRRRHEHDSVIVADAKYSTSPEGLPSGEQLKEVQAYLNAFGVKKIAIVHPSAHARVRHIDVGSIEAHGWRMDQIAFGAAETGQARSVLEELRRALEALETGATLY